MLYHSQRKFEIRCMAWTPNEVGLSLSLELDTESGGSVSRLHRGGSSPFPPVSQSDSMSLSLELDTESGGSALSLELDTESGGSSPFPPLDTESGYIGGMWVECILPRYMEGMWVECIIPICEASVYSQSLKVFCQAIRPQSAISESATVHYFSLVRALSSLHLEVLNSLPVGYVGECHCFSFVRALISLHIEVGLSYNLLCSSFNFVAP
ncbi:unnamed protein product [Rodentolepis nana]|uniref:Uncharacterized protein n=1 Tax=Rodentolepis nana TaxID=102285 RepID=A0A0R3T7K9_RODNA|nr:unnamed protein product [Rodentolepis nana]